jgi:hypothetical protein
MMDRDGNVRGAVMRMERTYELKKRPIEEAI